MVVNILKQNKQQRIALNEAVTAAPNPRNGM